MAMEGLGGAYHEGEIAVQSRAGQAERAQRVARGIHPTIPPVAADFLVAQRFVLLGAIDDGGAVWATAVRVQAGEAARVITPDLIALPADFVEGDPVAPLLRPGRAVGLLAFDPTTRKRMRVNGVIESVRGAIRISVREAYSNCSRFITRRSPATPPVHLVTGNTTAGKVRLPDELVRLLREADTLFVASAHPDRGADVSHRGGPPGFVTVESDGTSLAFPDFAGNSMFNTLGNLTVHPQAGLLAVDWGSGDLLHLSGTAGVVWDRDDTGSERSVRMVVERWILRPGVGPGRWTRSPS